MSPKGYRRALGWLCPFQTKRMGNHYSDFALKLNEIAWPNDQNEEQKDSKAGFCVRCHHRDNIDIFMNHASNIFLNISRASHLFAAQLYKVYNWLNCSMLKIRVKFRGKHLLIRHILSMKSITLSWNCCWWQFCKPFMRSLWAPGFLGT